ncbi:MAG: uracil phosphoribosyltransferase, partial [Alicyclobacillus sp.]|nr:uracil phosphoribosyltransferase [Alicyclobacillus sp.]
MGRVHVLEHPLIQHKLTFIRSKETSTKEFRELVEEVAMLMAYEITRNLPLVETTVE